MEGKMRKDIFDTLKVLAMKIAPGQEHLALSFEQRAKRTFYSDYRAFYPNIVYVLGVTKVM